VIRKPLLDLDWMLSPDRPRLRVIRSARSAPSPRPLTPADLTADQRFAWEERAAVMEYDGGLPRDRAERLALLALTTG
jgi:hypothetical protein